MRRLVVTLTALVAVAVPLAGVPAGAANPDPAPTSPEPRSVSTPTAARALAAARDLGSPGSRDATMVLRELRMQQDELGTDDRALAARILQRPGRDQSRCWSTFCLHWFTSGSDRSTGAYVDQVAATVTSVLATYRKAGYRSPKPDGRKGGNNKLDIYLQNLGSQGLYGYCDTDSSSLPPSRGPFDAPAYCAFDNNYAEFPNHTPLENLQVTAAHELFHAVQFAYDYYEDAWFMEATATWAEDELYDDVDDNLQYLSQSPLKQPAASMDHFGGVRQYGDWIFFRYLTERDPAAAGGMPTLVRAMWQRADGARGGPDDYSVQAISKVLSARGGSLTTSWARFAAANRQPAATYDEGRANNYPTAGLAQRLSISGSRLDSGWLTRRVDHLAAATVRFQRGSGLTRTTLRISIDLPPTSRGSGAVVTVFPNSGAPRSTLVKLNSQGNAVGTAPFGSSVAAVEVTTANAGIGYKGCWKGTDWSCQGTPLDNNLPMKVRAAAIS